MRFVLADENLVVAGRSFEGFPLLINDDGDAIQPAQSWLWELLGKSGRISSKKTWDNYGRAIYDFFAFVLTNGHNWKLTATPGMPGAIEAWRDWSRGTLGLDTSTINQRLRVVVRFYQWALRKGYIERIPFDNVTVQSNRLSGFLAHVDATGGKVETPHVLLQQKRQTIRFLTKEQITVCHDTLKNPTHRLMFELMVRTGMRQIEARTFPDAFVFDPMRRKGLQFGQKIRVHLDPKEMEIKNSKPRGLLKVNAPLGFGRTVIAPLVSTFTTEFPDVEVQLEVTDRPIDLIEEGFDLAVRFGELPDNRINARRIMSNRRFICASPKYLEKHGTPKTLGDLGKHRCIVHRQNDDAYGVWRFLSDGRTEIVKVHGALSSNDGAIVQGWALDGQGIVIRSEWDVAQYLESGRLRRILPEFALPSADLYAYYPSKHNLPARVRSFINFLVEQLAT